MAFELIVSQGRIGDRTSKAIEGAVRTAQALERKYTLEGTVVGQFAPAAEDDWRVSLPQARETLARLGQTIAASIKSGNVPVLVANTCSASLASLPIVAQEYPDAVVLWIDAHGDFNTPETTSRDTSAAWCWQPHAGFGIVGMALVSKPGKSSSSARATSTRRKAAFLMTQAFGSFRRAKRHRRRSGA